MGRASFASGGGDAVEQGALKQFGPAQQYFGPYSAAETALLYADQSVTYSIEDASPGVMTSAQVAAMVSWLRGSPLAITLDGSNRPVTLTKGANVFTIARQDSTHMTISLPNAGGLSNSVLSVVTTADGRVVSTSPNFL